MMDTTPQNHPDSPSPAAPGKLQRLRNGVRRTWLFAGGMLAALLAVLLYNSLFPPPPPLTQQDVATSIVSAMASATPAPAYSAQVYQVILPSLVYIQTQSTAPTAEEGFGVGSGVIINDGGDILTAFHVIAGANVIEIIFADGTRTQAEVLATEPDIDIAVLHPSQSPEIIVPAVLGNPGAMHVGDETYAVGNPLGLAGSLSAGVISGFDRSFSIEEDGIHLEGLIQFDAAVNPGNSGGPLLNRAGQVIGIVTALANPSEDNSFSGIGFAVPITIAGGAAGAPAH